MHKRLCFIYECKLNIKKFVLYLHTIYLTHLRRVNLRAETSSVDNTFLLSAWINKLYNSHKIKQISCVKQSAGWIYRIFIFLLTFLKSLVIIVTCINFFLDFNPVNVISRPTLFSEHKQTLYIVEQLFHFVWFENFDYPLIYDSHNKHIQNNWPQNAKKSFIVPKHVHLYVIRLKYRFW